MDQWKQSGRNDSLIGRNETSYPFWPSDQVIPEPDRPVKGGWGNKRRMTFVLLFMVCFILLGVGLLIGINIKSETTEPGISNSLEIEASSSTAQTPTGAIAEVDEPVASVAEAVAPSVVRIDTATGTGSGIIYDEGGMVVTNAHVVQGAESVEIQLADGTRSTGVVLGSDPNVDIAIVQVQGNFVFKQATFASLESVRVGQLAVAIGSPFGLEQSVTAGIVSAINRAVPSLNIEDGSRTIVEMIQTDAPINPGNSGGALVDRQGRVVGMNTLIRTDGTVEGNLGVGFAIPTDTIFLVTERIANGESLENGFLGISGQNPTIGRAGALIIDVVPESPAYESGLEAGDLIISIDGSPILGMSELAARIRLSSPGTTVEIRVVRNGEQLTFAVTLGTA